MPYTDLEKQKEYQRKYQKEYWKKNKEKINKTRKTKEKEISEYMKLYREKNKEKLKQKQKDYYQRKKESILITKQSYYKKNIDDIKEKRKKYKNNLAKYDLFYEKINKYHECRRDPNNSELIQVRCKYCNSWFNPTNRNLTDRLRSLYKLGYGDCDLYCSDSCKKSCPIFQKIKHPNGIKPATSREVQPELRKMVLERDQWTCQKCNKSKSEFSDLELHCHHIDPVVNNPIESADVDNCITLCKECHKEVHKNTGCKYEELRCEK